MMRFLIVFLAGWVAAAAEIPDARVRTFVTPTRIVWHSGTNGQSRVVTPEQLLAHRFGQIPEGKFLQGSGCLLSHDGAPASIVVDFGKEIHGGLLLGCGGRTHRNMRARIRFGESVAETMAELGERGACNDHAIRDSVIDLPWSGAREIGNTGFRFVRIDLITKGAVSFDYLRAVSLMRPMPRLGAFHCNDERLNAIWETAVRTVHLCCQEYLWDGIKRDRLVWMGDSHPELMSILAVFGPAAILPESLDYMQAITPAREWMNTMPSYTLWWVRCVHDWYRFTGDVAYLRKHQKYLNDVFAHLVNFIGKENQCTMGGFLDWPTQHNPKAVAAGMQALMLEAFEDGERIGKVLQDASLAARCAEGADRLRKYRPGPEGSKQAAAMLALAGLQSPREMFRQVLGQKGMQGVSTFYGYYMLEAMSAAGENQRALQTVRDYWGGMLDMGATSFWEDFNLAWTNQAFRIDEMPVPGKKDIHGDYGEFCYKGFRHSLCHGWSSGPAAWLIHHILGIQPVDVGCKTIRIQPFLGDLKFAEGSLALPNGKISVRHERKSDGTIQTKILSVPAGVKVLP